MRNEQAMRLTGWLNRQGRNPLQIVAGDFNEIPNGLAVRWMKQGFHSAYETVHGREPLATFPTALRLEPDGQGGMETDLKAQCLDYIFVSQMIQVESASLFCHEPGSEDGYLYPSDHAGLLSTIQWAF